MVGFLQSGMFSQAVLSTPNISEFIPIISKKMPKSPKRTKRLRVDHMKTGPAVRKTVKVLTCYFGLIGMD